MDLYRYIDLQCERTQPGLFEEPLNTLSGLLYFLVAYLLWKELNKHTARPVMVRFMIIMTALIGAGSMAFHMTAQMWAAMYADALPIAITAVTFLYLMTKHVLRTSLLGVLAMAVFFIGINVAFKAFFMRGPDGYISLVPTLMLLVLISIYMFFSKNTSFIYYASATLIACIALTFRIIDPEICEQFSHGTHFLWHSLMALFFFLVMREVVRKHRAHGVEFR